MKMIRVRAKEMGYYEHYRRRPGTVFEIPETKTMTIPVYEGGKLVTKEVVVKQFSPEWMEEVTKKVPLKKIEMPVSIGPDGKQQAAMGGILEKDEEVATEVPGIAEDEDGVL